MISMEELIRKGFKIIDGKLCDRYGTFLGVYVTSCGTNEYRFDNYDLHNYLIKKEIQYGNNTFSRHLLGN